MHEISVKDAAQLLRVSEKTIYRWLRQGVIPSTKFQGQYRFDRDELEAWASHKRIGSIALSEGSDTREESVNLLHAVRCGGIHYKLEGNSPEEVYHHVVELMPFPAGGNVLQGVLEEALLEREALASTGVGQGIALPHPRHPRDWGLGEPVCAVCFLEHPVDFQALDGQPVFILFVLLCATVKGHLRMLAHVSHLVNNTEMQAYLRGMPNRSELMDRIAHASADFGA